MRYISTAIIFVILVSCSDKREKEMLNSDIVIAIESYKFTNDKLDVSFVLKNLTTETVTLQFNAKTRFGSKYSSKDSDGTVRGYSRSIIGKGRYVTLDSLQTITINENLEFGNMYSSVEFISKYNGKDVICKIFEMTNQSVK
jgi:hypothetical protein